MNALFYRAGSVGIALFCLAAPGYAGFLAQLDFEEGSDGTQSVAQPPQLVWAPSSGHMAVSFPSMVNPPMPGDYAKLISDGGALSGNYPASEVSLVGFDFQADQALPRNGLRIELHGNGQMIYRDVSSRIDSSGSWHRVVVRVDDRASGGWLPADDALFADVVSNVQEVKVHVGRSSSALTTYRVDNLFLARMHRTAGMDRNASGQTEVIWADLLNDTAYRVESTTHLGSGVWRTEWRGSAPAEEIRWTATPGPLDDEAVRFFRLVLE